VVFDGVKAATDRGFVPRQWHLAASGRRNPQTASDDMPLNIPNLLTWARILLIPLVVGVYYLPLTAVRAELHCYRRRSWLPP
jgi:hypothetical protein